MKKFILILLFFTSYCSAQWFHQNSAIHSELSMIFVFNDTGYVGVSQIQKTTNGGSNWSALNPNIYYEGNSIYFINSLVGHAATYFMSYKTIDGGLSWIEYHPSENYTRFTAMHFISENTGFKGGQGFFFTADWTIIHKTTNGGNNWIQTWYLPDFTTMYDFCSFNNMIYAAGSNCLLKSSDLGNTWTNIGSLNLDNHRAIHFLNDNTGFVSSNSKLYKTVNGGNNWEMCLTNSKTLNDICFAGNKLFTIGDSGRVFVSTDMGIQWGKQELNTGLDLNSITFIDSETGYIAGGSSSQGLILKTTNGGGNIMPISAIIKSSNEIPKQFYLSQNYPNPFNPQTEIKFDVPKASFTKLIIFDLLGREVTTLVNEELKPGTYEADWDGSNFSSGVYFYKLITEGFVETKKMVLMK